MPYPFSSCLPKLHEFLACAKRLGIEEYTTKRQLTGPRGLVSFRYLRRPESPEIYALLPDVPEDTVLTPVLLSNLCRRLNIPPSEFGFDLGFIKDPFEPPDPPI